MPSMSICCISAESMDKSSTSDKQWQCWIFRHKHFVGHHMHTLVLHDENWYRMAVKEQERPRTIHASISIAQNLHLRKFQFPAVELVFKKIQLNCCSLTHKPSYYVDEKNVIIPLFSTLANW